MCAMMGRTAGDRTSCATERHQETFDKGGNNRWGSSDSGIDYHKSLDKDIRSKAHSWFGNKMTPLTFMLWNNFHVNFVFKFKVLCSRILLIYLMNCSEMLKYLYIRRFYTTFLGQWSHSKHIKTSIVVIVMYSYIHSPI